MQINGSAVDSADQSTKESINPATGAVLGTYPCATKIDIEKALDAAQKGKKVWSNMSFNQRAEILLKAADILEAHAEELAILQSQEMGKPIKQSRVEVTNTIALFRSSVAAGKYRFGQVFPNNAATGELGDIAFTVHEPLGVVCCIAPFNLPIYTLSFKVAPSLTMGNAVIIKAASDAAILTLRYAELLEDAGFPAGVVQAVSGPGSIIADWLIDTDKINAISFTGSTRVGSLLMVKSAPYFHRLLLELGGNDAVIICKDADMDHAITESMGRIANAGQICCITKRFLVHNSIRATYVKKLVEALKKVKMGDPLDPTMDMGPCVSESAAKEVERQIALTVKQGAKLVYGGTRKGAFIEPTLLDDIKKNMDVAKDMEIFGPVFSVIGFNSEDEAIGIANQSSFGLNGGIISGDLMRGICLASKMEAGTVVTNGASRWRRDTAPFGGYKMSGLGREGIEDILDEVSQRKTLVIKGV